MGYISVAEAALRWGVSERSVRNYCAQGRVPGAFQAGKAWTIPEDAQKPARETTGPKGADSPLLRRLKAEKKNGIRGGIYHKLQVELTYNSNRIEGSRLSLDQTRLIFETKTLVAGDTAVPVDDIIETGNHFRAVDYVIDVCDKPLSKKLIKELHRILKAATTDSAKEWFAVGEYKRLPNEVAGRQTTLPEGVSAAVKELLESYEPARKHTLDEIIAFHVAFERVHPFQDGNGRVGRLVMLKECLASGIVPFIIADDMKAFYYRGLSEWDREPGFLTDTCLAAQDRFVAALDYFAIEH